VWERRYGFPAPSRNAQDERVYSIEDLEKLRLVKRLTKGLNELRDLTPSDIEIWAGGNAKSLATYKSPGVRVLRDLEKIPEAIEVWRRGGQSTQVKRFSP